MANIESTPAFVKAAYDRMAPQLTVVRQRLNRPLSLAEKVARQDGPALDPPRTFTGRRVESV